MKRGDTETGKQGETQGTEVVVRYVAAANPGGATLPGVPLRDLLAQEWTALPVWLQESVMACAFYGIKAEAEAEVKG